MTVRRRQRALKPPDELTRGVVVGNQGLQLRTVSGAQL